MSPCTITAYGLNGPFPAFDRLFSIRNQRKALGFTRPEGLVLDCDIKLAMRMLPLGPSAKWRRRSTRSAYRGMADKIYSG